MKKDFLLKVAFAWALTGASPAAAGIITVTYTGSFLYGTDRAGVFGAAGADLTNDTFTALYQFDTNEGQLTLSPTRNALVGGSYWGYATPLVDATLTVNGASIAFGGSYYGHVMSNDNGGFSDLETGAGEIKSGSYSFLSFMMTDFSRTLPIDITKSFKSAFGGEGSLQYLTSQGVVGASGELNASSVSLSVSSRVPEESTWGMILCGFAGLGCMAYRRKSMRTLMAV